MRLEYLEYLRALKDHPSMSAASHTLHVTPQALSVAIGKMERELGVKLVYTDNRGARLNENGRYLVAKTDGLFEAIAELKGQNRTQIDLPEVRVLADKGIKEDFAADLMRRLDEATQPLNLALEYCHAPELEERFLSGNYDLALGYRDKVDGYDWQPLSAGLEFVSFWYSPMYVIMSCQHPLSGLRAVPLDGLSRIGIPLVVDEFGENFREILEMVAPEIKTAYEDNLIAMQKQVMNNFGVAIDYVSFDGNVVRGVPEGCVAKPLADNLGGDLGYFKKSDKLPSLGTRVFLDYLLNVIVKNG